MFLDVYTYGKALYILKNQPLIYIFIAYEISIDLILTNSIVSSCNVARNIYSNSKNNSTNAVCVGFDSSRYNKDFLNFLFE